MRALRLALALLPAFAAAAGAQRSAAAPASSGAIAATLDSLRQDPNGVRVATEAVHAGDVTVATGQTVRGDIAAWHGTLDVRGTVDGNAVALGGDVIVPRGGSVRGDAVSVGGRVRVEGGTVRGEVRTLSGLAIGPLAAERPLSPAAATKRSLWLAVGWYLVLAAIGLAVTMFARGNLETIAETVRENFSRALVVGLLGEVALLPALALSLVALAITIIGILLIPFAIVAYVLAAAGALALGFLALSVMTGEAVLRRREGVMGATGLLQLLLAGLSVFFVLWVIGAALTWSGLLGGAVRLAAAVVTWAAVTVGFGATIVSRGGTRAPSPPLEVAAAPVEEDYSWQTPTPVTGVAAARRPTLPPRSSEP